MARATPSSVMVVTMAGMAVVLCGGLVVMMRYARVEFSQKKGKPAAAPAVAETPRELRMKSLDRKAAAVVQGLEQDPVAFGRYVQQTDPGLYLDVLSDEVLFSSADKLPPVFGYAEFSKPVDPAAITEIPPKDPPVPDEAGTRVRSKAGGTVLGWIRADETGVRRWVINSSALRFVPAADLEKNGLEKFRTQFP